MAQLYLPAEHTDADLVLAGQIAESIDSAELYVAWTPAHGHAVPRGRRRAAPAPRAEPGPRALLPGDPRAVGAPCGASPRAGPRAPRRRRRSAARPPPKRASTAASVAGVSRRAVAVRRACVLALGRLGALARPRLVELDAPLALLALLRARAARGTTCPSGP